MKTPPCHRRSSIFPPFFGSRRWGGACVLVAAVFLLIVSSGWAVVSGNYYDLGNASSAIVYPPPTPPATTPVTTVQWVTFTASENSTISEAQLYNSAAISGSPILEVGLYAVNGSGVPTGSALSSSLIAPSGTGWQTAGLNYDLVKGTVYALRVSTSTPGTSYPWRLNFSPALNNIQPSGVADPHWMRGINSGAPANTSQNVWILKTGPNQAIGQPHTIASGQNLGSPGLAFGQRFRFELPSTGESLLENVSLKLNVSAAPPANPLVVKLLDKNGAVLTTGSIDLSTTAAGVGYFNIGLDTAQVLTAGEFYYLAVVVNSTVANTVTWLFGSTTNDPLYQSATYQGTDAYSVGWNSQSAFGAPTSTDLSRDYFFQLNLGAVPEPATWALLGLGFMVWTVVRRQRMCGGV